LQKSLDFKIKGMSCASCVSRVEKALLKEEGIDSAEVNLATEVGRVYFENKKIDTNRIISAIFDAGYEASVLGDDDETRKSDSEKSYKRQKWKVIISIILSLPLVFPMILEILGIHVMLSPWLQFIFATPIQFIIGAGFYKSAWGAVKAKTGNMELLVCMGTSSAYGLSVFHLLKYQNNFSQQVMSLYFESSAVIITLVLLGKLLENRAKLQTISAIKSLQNLRPQMARLLKGSIQTEIAIDKLRKNDVVIVLPGERIPADGIVVFGETQVDQSFVTGESLPIYKNTQSNVIGGSINGDGTIHVQVIATGTKTLLSKIIRMVEDAQIKKAPIQRLVDTVASYFVPVVIMIALVTLFMTVSFTHDWEKAILHSVAVLVIACPCALGLATPTSIMVGTGVAAKMGILIKDADALESMHHIEIMAFDKTGTLTVGKPSLKFFKTFDMSENDAFEIISSIQSNSNHPLAQAVLLEAKSRNMKTLNVEKSLTLPGRGVEAMIAGQKFAFINKRFLNENHISIDSIENLIQERELLGESISFLVNLEHKSLHALMSFKDTVKKNSRLTILKLKSLGIKTLMITGDNNGSAKSVAEELGLDDYQADVLPQDKSSIITYYKSQGKKVAMVGDGINDAPALAEADVGIAMSTGTDVAMQTSGITLMHGDPLLIPKAIQISRLTYRKIKQNLFWAFIYNILGIPLAAFGLLNPMIAGAAMSLSSICVVSNSLLLSRNIKRAE
jgi:Cu+-exporting ATPase